MIEELNGKHEAEVDNLERTRTDASVLEPRWTAAQIAEELAHDDATVLGARPEPGAGLDGWIALRRMGPDELWVFQLAVVPARRRQGVARELLDHAWQLAAAGGRSLWLEVRSQNLPARGLYEAWGFREVARRTGYYPPPPGSSNRDDAVIYTRDKVPAGAGSP